MINIKQTITSKKIKKVPGSGERPIDHMKEGMLTSTVTAQATEIKAIGGIKKLADSGLENK